MPANALVLLAEGAEEMETVIAVDVLRHKCNFFEVNFLNNIVQERWS